MPTLFDPTVVQKQQQVLDVATQLMQNPRVRPDTPIAASPGAVLPNGQMGSSLYANNASSRPMTSTSVEDTGPLTSDGQPAHPHHFTDVLKKIAPYLIGGALGAVAGPAAIPLGALLGGLKASKERQDQSDFQAKLAHDLQIHQLPYQLGNSPKYREASDFLSAPAAQRQQLLGIENALHAGGSDSLALARLQETINYHNASMQARNDAAALKKAKIMAEDQARLQGLQDARENILRQNAAAKGMQSTEDDNDYGLLTPLAGLIRHGLGLGQQSEASATYNALKQPVATDILMKVSGLKRAPSTEYEPALAGEAQQYGAPEAQDAATAEELRQVDAVINREQQANHIKYGDAFPLASKGRAAGHGIPQLTPSQLVDLRRAVEQDKSRKSVQAPLAP